MILYFLFHSVLALGTEINLSQKINFKVGDTFTLKNSKVSVTIGFNKGSECAVPGYNCGAGYQPPRPTYTLNCDKQIPCPYVVLMIATDADKGTISLESEESCVKVDAKNCFYQWGRSFKADTDCLKLKAPIGQYYCLEVFPQSTLPEAKTLCEKLPKEIYALQWNCFYEYAIRFKDPTFCDKYSNSKEDISGKNRCYLRMAEMFKDKKYCQPIVAAKDQSYKEQCEALKY